MLSVAWGSVCDGGFWRSAAVQPSDGRTASNVKTDPRRSGKGLKMKTLNLLIAGGIVIVGAMVFFGSWYQIDQGEEGVVLRTGAVTGTKGRGCISSCR